MYESHPGNCSLSRVKASIAGVFEANKAPPFVIIVRRRELEKVFPRPLNVQQVEFSRATGPGVCSGDKCLNHGVWGPGVGGAG